MPPRVLVVDDEENVRDMLGVLLRREGFEPSSVANAEAALKELERAPYEYVLCDIRMPGIGGLGLLEKIQERGLQTTVIVMSAYGSTDTALEAMKLGAYDYVSKPFKPDEIILTLRKAQERERLKLENQSMRRELLGEMAFEEIIARSPKMKGIFRTIAKVADYKSTVLITGESGTGKELVARALHFNGVRAKGPFVAVNCGAIPETLLESELFGFVRGAFTDATRDKKGLFEEANGGTLFLDEVGELTPGLQVKLLRVLQEDEVRRLGDSQPTKIDVRVVAATVRDLTEAMRTGAFREDLFYRLNVLTVALPPLRERREDIALLVAHFIDEFNKKLGAKVKALTPEAQRVLLEYPWPGNVRELENAIERAMVLTEGETLGVDDLPDRIRGGGAHLAVQLGDEELSIKKWSRAIEEMLIRKALERCKGNRTRASEKLEISLRALLYKIKEYGLT
jgi:two-component system response regulator AtoC